MPRCAGARRRKQFRGGLISAVGCVAAAHHSYASHVTWSGSSGANSNWSTAANWASNQAPANDGTADITMTGSTRLSPNVDSAWGIDSLSFNASAGAFVVGSQTLTIGSHGIANFAGNVETVNNPVVLGTDQIWNSGSTSGGSLFNDTSLNTNGHALTFNGTNAIVLKGTITGAGSLNVAMDPASGIVVDNASASYSGGTFISGGELYLTADTALGAAGNPITFSNGGLLDGLTTGTVNRDITLNAGGGQIIAQGPQFSLLVFSGPIHGAGSLVVDAGSGATIQFSGHNTYTGGTGVSGGTLLGTTDSIPGNVALTNNTTQLQFQQDTNGTYSGNISGGGATLKSGAGVVAFTGNNTYTGDTQIATGALEVTAAGTGLPAASRLVFQIGGGVIQYDGGATFTRTVGSNVIWDGAGGFAARQGKLTVNLGGAGATISFPSLGTGAGALVFGSPNSDSQVELQNPLALGNALTSPAPQITVNSGAGGDYATLSGQLSGANSLSKLGTGTLQLTAANTFTGGLTINAGTVQAADGAGLPTASALVLAGGVLMNNGASTFSRALGTTGGHVQWTGSGGFAASGGTFTVNIGGSGATQTWGGTNFVPTSSALILGATRANAETNFVNPINLGSSVREVHVDAGLGGDFGQLSGALSGTGGLVKTGTGELVLAGTNIYTGNTTVSAGSLQVTGSLAKTAITVAGGASLGGNGTIAGSITVAGGNSSATMGALNFLDALATDKLVLADPLGTDNVLSLGGASGSPSLLEFEVGATADSILDQHGKITVNAGGAVIDISPLAGIHAGTYDLLDFPVGSATGLNNLTLGSPVAGGYHLSLQTTSTAEQLVVVPEPEMGGVVLVGAGMLLLRRRRTL
jgi:autotransporter-associated beta strand protein